MLLDIFQNVSHKAEQTKKVSEPHFYFPTQYIVHMVYNNWIL